MKVHFAVFNTEDRQNAPHIIAAKSEDELLTKAVNWCKELYCMHDATAWHMVSMDLLNEWFQEEVGNGRVPEDNVYFIFTYTEEI